MDPIEESGLVFQPIGRYLSVHGSFIDHLGKQPHDLITSAHRDNRIKRDGQGHHITFINHLEIAKLPPPPQLESIESIDPNSNNTLENSINLTSKQPISNKQQKKGQKKALKYYASSITTQFGSASLWQKPVDLGVGTANDECGITYFRVIHWPFGQYMRDHLGLPPTNFHITVGFKPNDVHLYKGPASLLCLNKGEVSSKEKMAELINYATYYFNDKDFIRKLYSTCWCNGYYRQMLKLTRICLFLWLRKLFYFLIRSKHQPQNPNNETAPLLNVKIV